MTQLDEVLASWRRQDEIATAVTAAIDEYGHEVWDEAYAEGSTEGNSEGWHEGWDAAKLDSEEKAA